ncbi:MAG: hypothetical protein R3277_10305, partial [Brumimicrobium sp.]|nr:hypothetical protein [Brumimicrobium sp.]
GVKEKYPSTSLNKFGTLIALEGPNGNLLGYELDVYHTDTENKEESKKTTVLFSPYLEIEKLTTENTK